jgi:hypothetical protein
MAPLVAHASLLVVLDALAVVWTFDMIVSTAFTILSELQHQLRYPAYAPSYLPRFHILTLCPCRSLELDLYRLDTQRHRTLQEALDHEADDLRRSTRLFARSPQDQLEFHQLSQDVQELPSPLSHSKPLSANTSPSLTVVACWISTQQWTRAMY